MATESVNIFVIRGVFYCCRLITIHFSRYASNCGNSPQEEYIFYVIALYRNICYRNAGQACWLVV